MIDPHAHTWDADRIKLEIESLLPLGWSFTSGEEETSDYFRASFEDAEGATPWEDSGPFAQVILFNAYGWLFARTTLASNTGPWRKRRDLTLVEVNAEVLRKARVPDPEDLDPDAIQAVYDAPRK